MNNYENLRRVLLEFIDTVEATGGVVRIPGGLHEPKGDREWLDIGECYVKACDVLGREPMVEEEDGDEEDFDEED